MTFPMTGKAPSGYRAFSTLNPQQSQLFGGQAAGLGTIQPQIMQYLSQLLSGSPEAMQAFEAPYMRKFQEEIVPGLAERFAGQGALSSSGFQQSLGQAGAGLTENLAALREGLRSQAAGQGMGAIQDLLGLQTQGLVPKKKSFLEQLLLGLSGGVGQGIGMLPGMFR